jgi:hypothetical protein
MSYMTSVATEKVDWLVSRGGEVILETKIEVDVLMRKEKLVANVNRFGAVRWNTARTEHTSAKVIRRG